MIVHPGCMERLKCLAHGGHCSPCVQESTDPTDENKEASLVKALAPPSLQEAVRPHNLKGLYKQPFIQVEQGDEKSFYVCTVETGRKNKSIVASDVQVGTTSDHSVAIIDQVLTSRQ